VRGNLFIVLVVERPINFLSDCVLFFLLVTCWFFIWIILST